MAAQQVSKKKMKEFDNNRNRTFRELIFLPTYYNVKNRPFSYSLYGLELACS